MTLIRVFDLVLVCGSFLASLAVSSGSLTWPGLAEVLVIRIKVGKPRPLCGLPGALLGGLLRLRPLSIPPPFSCKATTVRDPLSSDLRQWSTFSTQPFFLLAFATNSFLFLFCALTFCTLVLSHETALWLLYLARLMGGTCAMSLSWGRARMPFPGRRIGQEASLGYRVLRIIDARGIDRG